MLLAPMNGRGRQRRRAPSLVQAWYLLGLGSSKVYRIPLREVFERQSARAQSSRPHAAHLGMDSSRWNCLALRFAR